jgi:hypothetical protein
MSTLIREGGAPIIFVIVFGLATLIAAGIFAARGDRRRLGFIAAMALATLFSVLGAVAADIAAVGHHAAARCPQEPGALLPCLLVGAAESMAPAILGFTTLSLAALLAAVGVSRTRRAD